jgi:hypothetical protein
MKKVSEYREHAEECRTLARRSKSSADRDMLLNMAATWDSRTTVSGLPNGKSGLRSSNRWTTTVREAGALSDRLRSQRKQGPTKFRRRRNSGS